jgi:hypothetical protein
VNDKRLLIVEMEFARMLAVMGRDGSILSDTMRTLFDSEDEARSSPKGNAVVVTGPHVGFIGHVTPQELARKLREVEMFNGFSNRVTWVLTHRIHSYSNPPAYTAELAAEHAAVLAPAIARARALGTFARDDEAQEVWDHVYEKLRRDETRRGLAREVCARAQVMVMRFSLIFAALDGSPVITREHQEAALALWDYCEACAAYLFDDVSGDPIADVIADALNHSPQSRTKISGLFRRHVEKVVIDGALDQLVADGRAYRVMEETAGRSCEMWYAKEAAQADQRRAAS